MLYVSKFGGSSTASREKFLKIKDVLRKDDRRKIVVVSAAGKITKKDNKITDLLFLLYAHLRYGVNYGELFKTVKEKLVFLSRSLGLSDNTEKELDELEKSLNSSISEDFLVSRGEYFTAKIAAEFLGYKFIDAANFVMLDMHGNVDYAKSRAAFESLYDACDKIVVPGFYGVYPNGKIHLFSRGGGDVSGAILANLSNADLYENWTDVNGILSADPSIIDNPKTIRSLNYAELRELSYMGAKVLHEETVFPLIEPNIPINIKNLDNPDDDGTMISANPSGKETVTGISGRKNFLSITLSKKPQYKKTDVIREVLLSLEKYSLELEHMPTSIDSFSIVLDKTSTENCLYDLIGDLNKIEGVTDVCLDEDIALIAVVGRNMVFKPGISGKLFAVLGENNINIKLIAQGSIELAIVAGVSNKDFVKAIKCLYKSIN